MGEYLKKNLECFKERSKGFYVVVGRFVASAYFTWTQCGERQRIFEKTFDGYKTDIFCQRNILSMFERKTENHIKSWIGFLRGLIIWFWQSAKSERAYKLADHLAENCAMSGEHKIDTF